MIVGHRPYDIVLAAIANVAPDLSPQQFANDPVDYVLHWGSAIVNEVAEALSVEDETARRRSTKRLNRRLSRRGEHLYVPALANEESKG